MQTDSLKKNYTLPQIPCSIYGNAECSLPLTDRSKCDWKFLFEEIKNIPNAFENEQNFDFSKIDDSKWQSVIVPSSLVMQGFDIENNTEYYYKRTVKIPESFKDNQIFIRFEGVYSNARVWVNNIFICSHIGGFTPFDADITEFADCNEITLVVGVSDIEGDKKGVWNTDGSYDSNSAWASYYAHHNIGGILRDITMFCLPKKAIIQTHIDTFVNGSTSVAKINCAVTDNCIGLKLKAQILDKETVKAEKDIEITSAEFELSVEVLSADLWTAEKPNLYTLKLTLVDGNIIQENQIKFGFREITYGGKNGTDKNKIYVNGNEIKLHGVCRHDVSRLYGRSVTHEDIYNEIKTYKEHNINHIRTSHYPVSEYMLSVCDEIGMYVEQENSACFKGANDFDVYSKPEDFLRSFAEMTELSRNHPSVIIWSIANESGFEKSTGFRDCYNYIKKTDLTRPVIFSYPFTVKSKPLPYDIFSKHYAKVYSYLGKKNMPILHDEFAHVPCYNLDDLTYDNSCRVFWGESIKRGWDKIFNTSGALGCDIWAATDDVFYLPEKNMEKHQNHLKGECAGYGEWGCVFDPFKRLKPEAYLTKKAFSPIHIIKTDIYGDKIRFKIQNRFDHTNLNEVETVISNGENIIYRGKIEENIEPHKTGSVCISPVSTRENMTVKFIFNGVEVESTLLNPKYEEMQNIPCAFSCDYNDNGILIKSDNQNVAFVGSMNFDGKTVNLKKTNSNTYSANFGTGKSFILSITEGDKLSFEIKPDKLILPINEITLNIELPGDVDSVSWQRDSLYGIYPSGHIARNIGTSCKKGTAHKYDETDLSGTPWEQDMGAYSYFTKNSPENKLASNDFKTKRLNIKTYSVNMESGLKLIVQTDEKHINAYANPFNNTLQISKGNFFSSIAWGNYFGKIERISKSNKFEFSLCVSKG